MIEKRCKHTDNTKYKHSHQKNAKSEVKHLTRSSVPDTIFSNKQQATSNKQQATSNKQQSGIKTGSAQTNFQLNTNFLTVHRTHKPTPPSLCVFYITHSIKPQGTQRAQRMIKEAITKTPLKTFAKLSFAQRLACAAVKLKNIRRLINAKVLFA